MAGLSLDPTVHQTPNMPLDGFNAVSETARLGIIEVLGHHTHGRPGLRFRDEIIKIEQSAVPFRIRNAAPAM
jgi:hypothetical protein